MTQPITENQRRNIEQIVKAYNHAVANRGKHPTTITIYIDDSGMGIWQGQPAGYVPNEKRKT